MAIQIALDTKTHLPIALGENSERGIRFTPHFLIFRLSLLKIYHK
jgi:hypothetical protein